MLFILYNNVVLSLFFFFFSTSFTLFFIQDTHTFYTFYIYSIHILFIFLVIFYHFYTKIMHFSCIITHFRVFLTHFRVFCPSISYNFLYICTSIARISLHTRTAFHFASFFIFCTFAQTFSTHCTKLRLRSAIACTDFLAHLHKLFPACRHTFSSL